jgi:YVTN family beta-propeller protein
MSSYVVNTISVGQDPSFLSYDGTYLWVTNTLSGTVTQINAASGTTIRTISVGSNPYGISSNGINVWVAVQGTSNPGTLKKIDISTGDILETITVGNDPYAVLSNETKVWVANYGSNSVSVINISTSAVQTISVGTRPFGLSSDTNYIWVTNTGSSSITKINISTNAVLATISTGSSTQPFGISSDGTYLWVVIYNNNNLIKIDIANGDIIQTIPVGSGPIGVFSSEKYVWVTNNNSSTIVSKIDISSNTVVQDITVGLDPYGIVGDLTNVWVANFRGNSVSQILINDPEPLVCFLSNTKILTSNGYLSIQDLRKGDLIKTLKNGYKAIDMIGKREIYHPVNEQRIKDQLYRCKKENYPELTEDLMITGCHSILVDWLIQEQGENIMKDFGDIYITEDKVRLPAYLDDKTCIYEYPGTYTIYHLALENEDYYNNYGIYANGLLVESCSKRYLLEYSNMELLF